MAQGHPWRLRRKEKEQHAETFRQKTKIESDHKHLKIRDCPENEEPTSIHNVEEFNVYPWKNTIKISQKHSAAQGHPWHKAIHGSRSWLKAISTVYSQGKK